MVTLQHGAQTMTGHTVTLESIFDHITVMSWQCHHHTVFPSWHITLHDKNVSKNISLQSPEIFECVFKLQKTNAVFDASDEIRQQLKVNDCLQSYLFQMIRYLLTTAAVQ